MSLFRSFRWKHSKMFRTILLILASCSFISVYVVNQRPSNVIINKRILFWTPFLTRADFYIGFGSAAFQSCPFTNCETTNDRSLLSDSDAIVFHASNVELNDLPKRRHIDQRWIFFYLEPPFHTPKHMELATDMFNWTMTYRTDSDIAQSYIDHMKTWSSVDSSETIKSKLKSKRKLIAWFVSRCKSESKREKYVDELKKFADVDIYGECGPLKCADRARRNQCYSKLTSDYKFYLAFENSICRDYVTEKFYNSLANYVVPIVNGGVDYSQFAPPRSYIDIRDFQNAKALAEYLKYLDGNQTAYEEYFDWRKTYVPKNTWAWCQLCEMLNNSTLARKSYGNVYQWWVAGGECNAGRAIRTSRPELSFNWIDTSSNK